MATQQTDKAVIGLIGLAVMGQVRARRHRRSCKGL
jgi:6-phosphogluconate dehydrogenase